MSLTRVGLRAFLLLTLFLCDIGRTRSREGALPFGPGVDAMASGGSVAFAQAAGPSSGREKPASDEKKSKDDGPKILLQVGEEKRVQYERELLSVVRSVLASQLEPGQFLVTLTAELDTRRLLANFERTRTERGSGGLAPSLDSRARVETFYESMPKDVFQDYLRRVRVRLFLDKSLPDILVKVISELVERQAGLRKARGDALVVEKTLDGLGSSAKLKARVDQLTEDLSRARSEKDLAATRVDSLEQKVRQAEAAKAAVEAQKIQLETQSRVSDNLKLSYDGQLKQLAEDLTREKEQKRVLAEKIGELEKEATRKKVIAEATGGAGAATREEEGTLDEKSPLGRFKKLVQGAEIPFTVLPVGVALCLVIVLVSLLLLSAQNARTRKIVESVGLVAQALQKAGEARGGVGGAKELAALLQKQDRSRGAEGAAVEAGGAGGHGVFEHARGAAEDAWGPLLEERYLAFSLLKDAVHDGDQGPVLLVTLLEAVGVARARGILETLPREELDIVRRKEPAPLPASAGFRAVTDLYRRVRTEASLRPAWFARMDLDALLAATDARVAAVIDAMEPSHAALALLFLTPARASRVVGALARPDKEVVLEAVPSSRGAGEADAERVRSVLVSALQRNAAAAEGFDVTGHLVSFLEKAPLDVRGAVQRALESDAELKKRVRERVITFEDLLKLDRAALVELVGGLEAEDLAALLLTQPEPVSQGLLSLLPPKVAFSAREELKRALSRPMARRRAERNGQRVQADLVLEARAMIAEGTLPPAEEWGQAAGGGGGTASEANSQGQGRRAG